MNMPKAAAQSATNRADGKISGLMPQASIFSCNATCDAIEWGGGEHDSSFRERVILQMDALGHATELTEAQRQRITANRECGNHQPGDHWRQLCQPPAQ